MKLIVKNQRGENLNLEILPEDTFIDVQNRILENGNIILDMAKLATPDKPLNMSANVVEYFGIKNNPKPENESTNLESIPTLDSKINKNVENSQQSCFNKINSNPAEKEGEKWNELPLEGSEDGFDLKESEEQIKDEYELSNTFQINLENVPFPANLLSEPMPLCRLCAQEIYDDDLAYLHEENSVDKISIVDKINACLPVSVSLEDKLPKQVCSGCLYNLESSYSFSCSVNSAEEKLNSLLLSAKAEDMNCPLCCEGYMETVAGEGDSDDALTDESQAVSTVNLIDLPSETGKQNATNSKNSDNVTQKVPNPVYKIVPKRKRGRPRKYSEPYEDVKVCDSEYGIEPAEKKTKHLRKGRPKGSKIKCSFPKNMNCFICHFKYKDYNDALAHTLNAHCDGANQIYPCPFCESIVTSEFELSEHFDTHTNQKEVVIIQCGLCDMRCSQASEIHKHVLQKHLTIPTVVYVCPLCEVKTSDCDTLLAHIILEHVNANQKVSYCPDQKLSFCPICTIGLGLQEDTKQHLIENHIEKPESTFSCTECCDKLDSQMDYLNHVVEHHCTSTTYKLPLFYSCSTCTSNFRSRYQLAKHTCTAAFDSLSCKDCNRSFPTKARFVFHLHTHQFAFSEMRCDECLTVFSDEDAFYDHVRFQHEPDEQIQCEECNKVFKNLMSLNMHMRRHQPNRDHACSECGKKFQNAQTLREHAVSHMKVKPFQCHICGAYLARLSRLRIHLRSHSVKSSKVSMKAYKCSLCSQLFPNTKVADKHSESHPNDENLNNEEMEVSFIFRCEFCDAFFQKANELNAHRIVSHPDPKAANAYTCSVCAAQFSTYARVTTHKLSHGINTETLIVPDQVNQGEDTFVIPQYFLCHECDKRTLNYTYLSLHRRFQHSSGKPIFTCSTCGEKFATSWSLQFHIKKNHSSVYDSPKEEESGKLFHCRFCDKPYMTQTAVESHVKRCHTDEPENFICETCGKTFQFKSALEAHADAHKGVKRFGCNLCEKRFTHRAGLIRHMKLHSENDPFVCEFCGKKFRDRTERENHRRAHTGERPFMCDICGRTFHTRAVWLDHSRIHLDIRPYQCDICNQTFRRSYALKSHYLIHTGERPNECEDCGRSFRLKQTLMAHRRKDHHKKNTSDEDCLPDEEAMAKESSQFLDDNLHSGDLAEAHMSSDDNLSEKNLVHSGTETKASNAEVVSDAWKLENKVTLTKIPQINKIMKKTLLNEKVDIVSTATDVQPGFSLLLKCGNKDIDDAVKTEDTDDTF